MTDLFKDPLGQAIQDFTSKTHLDNITVHSDLCDDDVLPVEYLFRNYNQMPEIEQRALSLCKGKILEVGAGTACHSKILDSKGLETLSIDTSKGAVAYIKSQNLNAQQISFLDFSDQTFDTILILMNGLGLAGYLNKMEAFLSHAKSLLNPNGIILADSSDIRYLYEDNEGGVWIDLNSKYPGEMQFNMEYKTHQSDWFPWVYVDFETLESIAKKVGLKATKLIEDDNFHYLVKLEHLII
jgi:SAM-dependent methyltransferase